MSDRELTLEELRQRLAPPPEALSVAELYRQGSPLERLELLAHLRAKLEVETGERPLRPGERAL